MPKAEGQIPSFIGGVSQQPASIRGTSQFEEQVNYLSDPVKGLVSRPPTEHLAKLGFVVDSDAFVHLIDRGEGNRQLLIIDNTNGMKVVDLQTGSNKTITDNTTVNDDYLDDLSSPREDLRAITEADTTFILNKKYTTAKTSTTAPTRNYEAIVYVRAGAYKQQYSVTLDDTEVWFKTDNDDQDHLDTESIAKVLTDEESATFGGGTEGSESTEKLNSTTFSGFTFTRIGNVIHISNSTDFTIRGGDGQDADKKSLVVAKDEIQDFADLPRRAKDGFTIKITGTPQTSFDDYWVKFVAVGDEGEGVWVETVEPGVDIEIDEETMPHKLIPNGTGFTYDTFTWDNREKGNDDGNPFPSFIGKTINDIFFIRDRLGFLSDESIICSQQGSYFNFFRTTITDLLDGDRIDTPVPSSKVAILKHALPLGENLLVTSKDQQFVFGTNRGTLLTPKTAAADLASAVDVDEVVKPINLGSYAYFASNGEQFARVNEMFYSPETGIQDPVDVTAAVPQYIPVNAIEIRGSENNKIVAILTSGSIGSIYVWKYFWNGQERVQSSWSRWELGNHIISADFAGSWLYVVRRVASNDTYVERINVESGYTFTGLNYRLNLDRLADETKCTETLDGSDTDITLPYSLAGETVRVVIKNGQTLTEGQLVFEGAVTGTGLTVVGKDLTANDYWVGVAYECRLDLSRFYVRDRQGTAVVGQSLKVKNLRVAYEDTGKFEVVVTINNKTYTYRYTGIVVGQTPIGTLALNDGTFKVPVGADSSKTKIAIKTTGYLPAQFTNAAWKGIATRNR